MLNRMINKIRRVMSSAKHENTSMVNLTKGNSNVIIDPSAIFTTPSNSKIVLKGDNYIGRQVEIGPINKIIIGQGTTLQDRCILLGDVEIGMYCTFAPNVYISSGRHYYNYKPNYYIKDQDAIIANDPELQRQHSKKVNIGDDCWLGINSVIMSGVTIGRGCIIGANSVVTKDIEPFSVVAGSPAKVIKKRLEFIAKTSISFNNENDLPNFYKGVLVKKTEINKYHKDGGLAALKQFTLYLSTEAKKIVIEIKKLSLGNLSINYNNQSAKLEHNEFIILTFNIGHDNYHNFTIDGPDDNNEICVLIKEVEVVN